MASSSAKVQAILRDTIIPADLSDHEIGELIGELSVLAIKRAFQAGVDALGGE